MLVLKNKSNLIKLQNIKFISLCKYVQIIMFLEPEAPRKFATPREGMTFEGVVKAVCPFGAFVVSKFIARILKNNNR